MQLDPTVRKLTASRCQCSGCGEFFNSTSAFDGHRVGGYATTTNRRCRSSDELIVLGWSRNLAGFWIQRPMPRERPTARVETPRRLDPLPRQGGGEWAPLRN